MMQLKTGLVSITFRQLQPSEIIALVCRAGLEGIEWGGDVHVPPGDLARAEQVRRLTDASGLSIPSYGSYYRVGEEPNAAFAAVQDTAAALGTRVIRVWAGRRGSREADTDYRQTVCDDARRIADAAAARDQVVAFEFHGGSLTDTTESALALLAAADRPNLRCYWQPPREWTEEELQRSLRMMCPHLQHLHVFQWKADGTRLPLAAGRRRWENLLMIAMHDPPVLPDVPYAMIEHVQNDDPQAFLADAATLKDMLADLSQNCTSR